MLGGVSPIELNGMVGRTQDFSAIKQNDDLKPVVDVSNSQMQVEKNVEHKASSVEQGQKTDTDGENSGGSKGSYAGDGGRRRKKNDVPEGGKMLVKSRGGFDIQI